MSRIIAIVLGIVVGIGVLWGGGWAIYKANLDQQNQANHTSQQYQDGLIAQVRDKVQGYDIATDPGQKKQLSLTICALIPTINLLPADLADAKTRIC
jgi:uncharacterized protein YxeA